MIIYNECIYFRETPGVVKKSHILHSWKKFWLFQLLTSRYNNSSPRYTGKFSDVKGLRKRRFKPVHHSRPISIYSSSNIFPEGLSDVPLAYRPF